MNPTGYDSLQMQGRMPFPKNLWRRALVQDVGVRKVYSALRFSYLDKALN